MNDKNDKNDMFLAFVANVSLKMTSYKKFHAIFQFDNLHVDFKNLIGFAIAIWEKNKPLPYFEGIKIAKRADMIDLRFYGSSKSVFRLSKPYLMGLSIHG